MPLARDALRLSLGRRLPLTRGTLRLPGVNAPLTIRRDRWSIPHIDAETDVDVWFGLGFCEGQDRAFQLELRLRTVRGTLSQLAGEKTLSLDRLARRIGFREASERQLLVLDADIRAQVEAFARGITAGMTAGGTRAHEFTLLRCEPTPWDAVDVIGVGKLVSFLLIGNWDVELARLKILREDGIEALQDLDPVPPGEPLPANAQGGSSQAIDRLSEDIAALLEVAGKAAGSNNWAIGPSRTASGRPVLANDPHLDPVLPPHWYLAHLRTPAWSVAGAALVGGPAIGAGHNGHCAWGITAALTDTTDLFIEEVGADGRSVRRGDAFVPCELRHEVIEVKGREPVVEDVLVTDQGPVISPALNGDFEALSLRAVWLDALPVRGFLDAPKARTADELRAPFAEWPLLAQNLVCADTSGNIAWQLVGAIPRRCRGWGTLPQPAADPMSGWEPLNLPFGEMPSLMNPPAGFIATANNPPQGESETPYLGVDWLDSYRFERISEAIAARNDWDVAACLRLQRDETSLPWRELRDTVIALETDEPDARIALDLLGGWDGVVSAGSPAASVYVLFVCEVWRRIAKARAPRSAEVALGRGFTGLLGLTMFATARWTRILQRLREQPSGWFARGWPAELTDALGVVVRELQASRGSEVASWAWGSVRPLRFEHPLGAVKQLAPIFNRGPFPWGGDSNTVAQSGTTALRPTSNPTAVASLRMAVEVGDWEGARFVLPGGQSGNPLSPHYDDQLPLWLEGQGVPIAWSNEAVAAATVSTLQIEPLSRSANP